MAVASRYGVLVRSAAFLETLAEVNTVAFDKTGTLTHGRLQLAHTLPAASGRLNAQELVDHAAALARSSTHPVSRAITQCAAQELAADDVHEVQGMGVHGRVNGTLLYIGRPEWVYSVTGVVVPDPPSEPASLVACADEQSFLGWILLQDSLRNEAAPVCAQLRRQGIDRQLLISGDRPQVVQEVGSELQFDSIHGGVLPTDKLALVEAEQDQGRRLLMVGDGINDALALRAGSVSLAMGGHGSDLALASADLVLMNDDLRRLPTMIRLARRCRQTVNVNVAIAIAWTVIMLVLASFGILGPLAATILHNVGTILVISNAGRLLRYQDQGSSIDNAVTLEDIRSWYAA